jgi:hypothetical protein
MSRGGVNIEQAAKKLILDGVGPPEDWRPRIRKMRLGGRYIKNPELLGDLQFLRELSLTSAKIGDLAPVAQLENLLRLNLSNMILRHPEPVGKLRNLRVLNLENTVLSSLEWVSGLKGLRELSLTVRPGLDLRPLTLLNLERLTLSFRSGIEKGEFPDLSILGAIKSLRGLRAHSLNDERLAQLSTLRLLTELDITAPVGADLSPLVKLSSLRSLTLGGWAEKPVTRSFDLHFVGRLKDLSYLTISVPSAVDLRSLDGLTELRNLSVYGSPVSGFEAVSSFSKLTSLEITKMSDVDISPIANVKSLSFLDLSCTVLEDIAPLARLENLQALMLDVPKLSDIRPLSALRKLYHLVIGNSNISTLEPLISLPQLRYLHVAGSLVPAEEVDSFVKALGVTRAQVRGEPTRWLSIDRDRKEHE